MPEPGSPNAIWLAGAKGDTSINPYNKDTHLREFRIWANGHNNYRTRRQHARSIQE